MYKSEFEYTLKSHLKYADISTGQMSVTDKLVLLAPSKRHGNLVSKFRQKLILAITKHTENKKPSKKNSSDSEEQIEGSEGEKFVKFLYTLSDIDMSEMFDIFGTLLVSGICLIPPVSNTRKILLTESLCNDLSINDFESMMGDYILNFFLS